MSAEETSAASAAESAPSAAVEVAPVLSAADIERLRIENEALKQQLAEHAAEKTHRQGWRWPVAIILLVLGLLVLGIALPTVWVNRTIMNTDQWVATVGPLADDPDIQNAVAEKVNTAIFNEVDVEATVKQYLPDQLDIIAAPIAGQIESYVSQAVYAVVRSDQFSEIWKEVMTAAQKGFVAGVKGGGEGGVVTTAGGIVTVNTAPVMDRVQTRIESGKLSGIAQYVPWDRLDKSIVVAESPALARLQQAVAVLNALVWLFPLLGIALVGGAIFAAPVRRRMWLWFGIGLVVVTLLPLEALVFARMSFVNAAYATLQIPTPAAQSFWDIVFRFLVTMQKTAIVLGLVIAVAAFLAGPARIAVWFRHGISGGLGGLGGHRFGRFGAFVASHKAELRIAGVVIAVLIALLSTPLTPGMIVGLAVAVLVWLLLIELFGGTQGQSVADQGTADASPPDAGAAV